MWREKCFGFFPIVPPWLGQMISSLPLTTTALTTGGKLRQLFVVNKVVDLESGSGIPHGIHHYHRCILQARPYESRGQRTIQLQLHCLDNRLELSSRTREQHSSPSSSGRCYAGSLAPCFTRSECRLPRSAQLRLGRPSLDHHSKHAISTTCRRSSRSPPNVESYPCHGGGYNLGEHLPITTTFDTSQH